MKNISKIIFTILLCTALSAKITRKLKTKRDWNTDWIKEAKQLLLKDKQIIFSGSNLVKNPFVALFKAEQNKIEVAVKFSLVAENVDQAVRNQFDNEIETVQKVSSSKFLVPFCSVGTVSPKKGNVSVDFIVFPRAKHDLRMEVSKKKCLKHNEKVKTAIQMAFAVKDLHDLNIIHRDIKPDNFLRMADGRVFLTDFEFATEYEQEAEMPFETVFYVPFDKKGVKYKITKEMDVFALGVSIGELIVPSFEAFLKEKRNEFTKNNEQPSENDKFFKEIQIFYDDLNKLEVEISQEEQEIRGLLFKNMLVPLEKGRVSSETVLSELKRIFPVLYEEVVKEYGENKPDYCEGEKSKIESSYAKENKSLFSCTLI